MAVCADESIFSTYYPQETRSFCGRVQREALESDFNTVHGSPRRSYLERSTPQQQLAGGHIAHIRTQPNLAVTAAGRDSPSPPPANWRDAAKPSRIVAAAASTAAAPAASAASAASAAAASAGSIEDLVVAPPPGFEAHVAVGGGGGGSGTIGGNTQKQLRHRVRRRPSKRAPRFAVLTELDDASDGDEAAATQKDGDAADAAAAAAAAD